MGIPSAKEVFDYYQYEAKCFGGHHQRFMYTQNKPWHEARLKRFYELLDKYGRAPYLDVGCAEGWFLASDEWTGIDISLPKLQRGKGVRIWADWDSPPFQPASFNTVFFADGLEHSRHPQKTVDALVPICRTGGHLIFSVTGYCKGVFGRSGHLHRITENHVETWLRNTGLELVEFNTLDVRYKFIMGVLRK
jgi:SAM-dependent methyltransferase